MKVYCQICLEVELNPCHDPAEFGSMVSSGLTNALQGLDGVELTLMVADATTAMPFPLECFKRGCQYEQVQAAQSKESASGN